MDPTIARSDLSLMTSLVLAVLLIEHCPHKFQMRLVIEATAADVGEWAAKYIKKRINDFKPGPDKYFTLGLPTGAKAKLYGYSLFCKSPWLIE